MSKNMTGLNPRIEIDFPIEDKVTVTVSYKELGGKKAKTLEEKFKNFNKANKAKNRILKKINILEVRIESLRELEKCDREIVKDTVKLSELYDELQYADENYEKLGGDNSYEEFHKGQFLACVESEDLKILTDAIEEESSYFKVLQMIIKAVKEKKGN